MAQTQVTNTSGKEKTFGFLPPHGVRLANGQSKIFDGDLRTTLASGRGRYSRSTELKALQTAVDFGDLGVTELPDPPGGGSSL